MVDLGTITCNGLVGFILGHKFQPVYDTDFKFKGDSEMVNNITNALSDQLIMEPNLIENILHRIADKKEIYVQHVCIRCGAVVHRHRTDLQ
jgi:hypothetical protein